ncbi:enoyl-CoA hydratase/isomerase family protein [Streptomyces lushanensis]|uniref:enoyl-CoA hydratase/isomerase family protein n=1 Tax=Streptomyces lushanensis TaxID=1434255 RepID=UPI00082B455E|nr:enoyl-CoA hydratase-related protein [Streptomyces lushanensis]
MADTVLYDVTDGLATITINRPEAMNALNVEAKVALRDVLRAAADDSGVRAVLLTASGDRAFSVGQDLKEHTALLEADRESGSGDTMRTVREHYNPILRAITGMPKPVVAGINGVAAGAGLGFALAADHRLAADTATFNTAFAGVALTADSGVSWTLPRLIGLGRATDLLLFPRSVKAPEAYGLGMVDRLVPAADLPAEVAATARALASGPTLAYAALKESLAYGAAHPLAPTLEKENELQSRAGASEDHAIALRAFLAKEKPRYTGR